MAPPTLANTGAYCSLIIASGASPLMIASVAGDGGYSSALVVSSIGTILGAVVLLCIPAAQPHVRAVTVAAQ